MVRWLVPLILGAAVLAGCIQESDDLGQGEPEDDGASVPSGGGPGNTTGPDGTDMTNTTEDVVSAAVNLTATGCNAVALLAIDDYGNIDDFLPAGFIPADVFSLLRLQDTAYLGQGAIGPVAAHCEDNDITGRAFDMVLPGTLVYTPELDGIETSWVDGYEDFIAVNDPVLADLFASFGWDVRSNFTMTLSVHVDEDTEGVQDEETAAPGVATAEVEAMRDGETLFHGWTVGTATYHTHYVEGGVVPSASAGETSEFIRFWHDTPEGLSYIENLVSEHGRSGGAACTFAAEYAETFGRTTCGPDNLGLIIADFELQTTLIRLDGVHA